jgi:hypothetical protein
LSERSEKISRWCFGLASFFVSLEMAFDNWTQIDHSNTGIVRFLDHYCILDLHLSLQSKIIDSHLKPCSKRAKHGCSWLLFLICISMCQSNKLMYTQLWLYPQAYPYTVKIQKLDQSTFPMVHLCLVVEWSGFQMARH